MDIYDISVWIKDETNSHNICGHQQIIYTAFSGIPETLINNPERKKE